MRDDGCPAGLPVEASRPGTHPCPGDPTIRESPLRRLRAVLSQGDLDPYWCCHTAREHETPLPCARLAELRTHPLIRAVVRNELAPHRQPYLERRWPRTRASSPTGAGKSSLEAQVAEPVIAVVEIGTVAIQALLAERGVLWHGQAARRDSWADAVSGCASSPSYGRVLTHSMGALPSAPT